MVITITMKIVTTMKVTKMTILTIMMKRMVL